jgi:acyl-CoA thioesterase-2
VPEVGRHDPAVDAAPFLGLEPTDDPLAFRLPVTQDNSVGSGFLFGGAALGASIEALEAATGRPLIWATCQYLSYARPPSTLDLRVTIAAAGRQTTQARCTGAVGDTEIFTVNAALGSRPMAEEGEWAVMPHVPPPSAADQRHLHHDQEASVMRHVEMRMVRARQWDELDGTPGDGRSALWARVPGVPMSTTVLGLLGDWVPFGIGQALGVRGGGNSLDNTLRVARVVPTDWVLLDIRVHAVASGFGHGLVHLWAEDGTLLGTASQSTIVRFWKDEG